MSRIESQHYQGASFSRPSRREFLIVSGKAGLGIAAATFLSSLAEEDIPDSDKKMEKESLNKEGKSEVINSFTDEVISAYQEAEIETGIPWQVIAGIHYREGSANANHNLQDGGRAMDSLIDSAVQMSKELKGKIGGEIPRDFKELAYAVFAYNGLGGNNYGKSPYPYEPRFKGDDSNYALNMFDDGRHETMYLIYCKDGQKCKYGTKDKRPGALTVAKWLGLDVEGYRG